MTITPTALPEVLLIQPNKFEDKKAGLWKALERPTGKAVGHALHFCQDNQAQSTYGVIRGLHYQMPPHAQSKLVYVPQGEVLDIVVDIRKGSSYFGKHLAIELSSKNQRQLFIPRGFAHGYACLSQMALLSYKVDSYYNKALSQNRFNDPQLAIDWQIPINSKAISKGSSAPTFEGAQHFDNNSPYYD